MYKKIILCIFLILFSVYAEVEWEVGHDITINYSSELDKQHILQKETKVPRDLTVKVAFKRIFSSPPKVLIAPKLLDWQAGQPMDFTISLQEVSTEYFTYNVQLNTKKSFQAAYINYLAILGDNSIYFEYFQANTPNIQSGKQKYEKYFFNFKNEYNEIPTVSVFFLGASFIGGDFWGIDLSISQVTTENAQIYVEALGDSKIQSFNGVYLIMPSTRSFYNPIEVRDSKYLSTGKGRREESISFKIPIDLEENQATFFFGLKGFQASSNDVMRIGIDNIKINDQNFSCTPHTWGNSVVFVPSNIQYQYKTCAKLYSKCYYQGQMIELCPNKPNYSFDMVKAGFFVKSVRIPKGFYVNLYDSENLGGQKIEVREDIECAKEYKFTF